MRIFFAVRAVVEIRSGHFAEIDSLVQTARIQNEIANAHFVYKSEELSTNSRDCLPPPGGMVSRVGYVKR